ncbi:hypothetical protein AB1L30_12520 [Bremerella sp. JC817]|uniref:hypothetical protein n=1 Tax=Bremerella sp. JC817 TaxID=3231756 RepID=UPI003458C07C
MSRAINLTVAFLLVGSILVPAPAQAGWNGVMRFFGEFWSDGYHSKGDAWNRPTHHEQRLSTYQPYYPVQVVPNEVIEIPTPTPALPKQAFYGVGSPTLARPISGEVPR